MMLDDRDHRDFSALRGMSKPRADWTLHWILGGAALGLLLLGYLFGWLVDHSVGPALIALAEALR